MRLISAPYRIVERKLNRGSNQGNHLGDCGPVRDRGSRARSAIARLYLVHEKAPQQAEAREVYDPIDVPMKKPVVIAVEVGLILEARGAAPAIEPFVSHD